MLRTRVFIEDSRANGLYLRTTWHAEENQFVISTWDDTVCTGAVRVPAEQAAALIGLLADGLADAATRHRRLVAVPPAEPAARGRRPSLQELWQRVIGRRRSVEPVPPPGNVVPLWARDDLG